MKDRTSWSILSNVVNYIQYDKHPKNYHSLNISAVNKENIEKNSYIKEEGRDLLELDFGCTPDRLKEEYLDVYKGMQSDILSTTRLDKTTYLGKADRSKNNEIRAKESFPISKQGYTMGQLLDGTECQILLDMGASKSFMSKLHYLCCKSLHSLPKFASKPQRKFISILFLIPIIGDIHGHRFEIYTSVSEIHENVDLVLGIKNEFELEGIINS